MNRLIALVLCCALGACSVTPPAPRGFVAVDGGNTCLVDAVAWQKALKVDEAFGADTWTGILGIEWRSAAGQPVRGHAVCVYEFERGLWAYTSSLPALMPGGGSILLCTLESGDPRVTRNQPRYLASLFMGSTELFERAWWIQRDP